MPGVRVPSLVKQTLTEYLQCVRIRNRQHSFTGKKDSAPNSIFHSCRRDPPVDRKLYHQVRNTVIEGNPEEAPLLPCTCLLPPSYTPDSFPHEASTRVLLSA